jgi:TubC N-terminal docking domain
VTAIELLAELHRRGITVGATGDGRLRLTGPAEAALTPALRRNVEALRRELVALLAAEVGGPTDAATAARPPDAAAPVLPAQGSSELSGSFVWSGLAVVVAVLGAAYLIGRTSAAPAPEAPPPAPMSAWPYSGQSWDW